MAPAIGLAIAAVAGKCGACCPGSRRLAYSSLYARRMGG